MFQDHVKIELEEFKDGEAICHYQITEDGVNEFGAVHGGMLAAIADHVAGFAAMSNGRQYVSQCCSMNFTSNQKEGIITAKASTIHEGRKTSVVHVDIVGDNEKLLLTGTFTMYCVGTMTEDEMKELRRISITKHS